MENIKNMKSKERKESKEKNNKKINDKEGKNQKYDFINVFNYLLINAFRIILLFLLISSIIKKDKEQILLVSLCSITSFYRELIFLFTKIRISVVMQIIFTTFLILSILFGTLMKVYDKVPWWDTMLHGVSGILLVISSLMVLAMMKEKNKNIKYSVGLVVSYAFFFSMTAGVIWELLEFTADNFFGMNAQRAKGVEYGVLDTMQDIIANTVGTTIACIVLFSVLTKKSSEEIYLFLKEWFLVPEDDRERRKRIHKIHKKQITESQK